MATLEGMACDQQLQSGHRRTDITNARCWHRDPVAFPGLKRDANPRIAVLGAPPGLAIQIREHLGPIRQGNGGLREDTLDDIGEEAKVAGREIYVHYPIGSGKSKLKLPALKSGTSRNLNTVRKLAEMAAAMEDDD